MSIFEYVPEFYKAQWGAQLFPYKAMLLLSLVFLNSILFEAMIRTRRSLEGAAYLFLPGSVIFVPLSIPLGLDLAFALMSVTGLFLKFVNDERIRRMRKNNFETKYMTDIAMFLVSERGLNT